MTKDQIEHWVALLKAYREAGGDPSGFAANIEEIVRERVNRAVHLWQQQMAWFVALATTLLIVTWLVSRAVAESHRPLVTTVSRPLVTVVRPVQTVVRINPTPGPTSVPPPLAQDRVTLGQDDLLFGASMEAQAGADWFEYGQSPGDVAAARAAVAVATRAAKQVASDYELDVPDLEWVAALATLDADLQAVPGGTVSLGKVWGDLGALAGLSG